MSLSEGDDCKNPTTGEADDSFVHPEIVMLIPIQQTLCAQLRQVEREEERRRERVERSVE